MIDSCGFKLLKCCLDAATDHPNSCLKHPPPTHPCRSPNSPELLFDTHVLELKFREIPCDFVEVGILRCHAGWDGSEQFLVESMHHVRLVLKTKQKPAASKFHEEFRCILTNSWLKYCHCSLKIQPFIKLFPTVLYHIHRRNRWAWNQTDAKNSNTSNYFLRSGVRYWNSWA